MPKRAATPQTSDTLQNLKSCLSAEISHIAGLSKDRLRTAWATEFRKEPPKRLTRDLLLRTLAWRLQEKVFGGHDQKTLKLHQPEQEAGHRPRRSGNGPVDISQVPGVGSDRSSSAGA